MNSFLFPFILLYFILLFFTLLCFALLYWFEGNGIRLTQYLENLIVDTNSTTTATIFASFVVWIAIRRTHEHVPRSYFVGRSIYIGNATTRFLDQQRTSD